MQTSNNQLPEAYLSAGKNRLKLYGGNTAYLKSGQEFELELYNPTSNVVAAKIHINGRSISNSMIVLKPGERSWLERHLDDNKRFRFDTYVVEDTKQTKKAIEDNGSIKVEFFNELPPDPVYVKTYPVAVPYYVPQYVPVYPWWNPSPVIYGGTAGFTTTGTSITTSNATNTTTIGTSGTMGATGCAGAPGFQGAVGYTNTSNVCMDSMSTEKSIETGRVGKGSYSSQNLESYVGKFNYIALAVSEYKILPESVKQVEVSQIRQYCPACRTRIKKTSWQFCPSCGEKLD